MKNVIAKERGFYGGKIQEAGDPFIIIEDKHLGSWMEPQGWKPSSTTGSQGGGSPQPAFTIKHNGGGRWVVVAANGEKVDDFIGASKEEAMAEADRLNAGGDPYVKPEENANTVSQGGGSGDGGEQDDDDEGPDA